MCFAPTRSGKGRRACAADPVVLDLVGGGARHQRRKLAADVWLARELLALPAVQSDRRAERSLQPVARGSQGAAEVRDVQNIADILVDPEGALERRTHWEKTSHSLLVGVHPFTFSMPKRQKTLTRVTEMLADPAQSFEKTLQDYDGHQPYGHGDASRRFTPSSPRPRELAQQVRERTLGRALDSR